jgi:hypothetical protein
MKSRPKPCPVMPLPDETLLALFARTAKDWCLVWPDFQRVALGAQFLSSRHAERRAFDWDRLEESLGISANILFEMSERSFLVQRDDPVRLSKQRLQCLPWSDIEGYALYNPDALERSDHLRLSWLRPDLLVDPQSGTLFLHHCHECKAVLADVRWSEALPICPRCEAALAAAPKMDAPDKIVTFAAGFSSKVDAQFRSRPVDVFSQTLIHCAAIWHTVKVLKSSPSLRRLADYLTDEAGVGPLKMVSDFEPDDVGLAALRHAQLWVGVDQACRNYPAITRRFSVMVRFPRNLRSAPLAISRGLHELASQLKLL